MSFSTGMLLFLAWCLVALVGYLFFAGAGRRNAAWDRATHDWMTDQKRRTAERGARTRAGMR